MVGGSPHRDEKRLTDRTTGSSVHGSTKRVRGARERRDRAGTAAALWPARGPVGTAASRRPRPPTRGGRLSSASAARARRRAQPPGASGRVPDPTHIRPQHSPHDAYARPVPAAARSAPPTSGLRAARSERLRVDGRVGAAVLVRASGSRRAERDGEAGAESEAQARNRRPRRESCRRPSRRARSGKQPPPRRRGVDRGGIGSQDRERPDDSRGARAPHARLSSAGLLLVLHRSERTGSAGMRGKLSLLLVPATVLVLVLTGSSVDRAAACTGGDVLAGLGQLLRLAHGGRHGLLEPSGLSGRRRSRATRAAPPCRARRRTRGVDDVDRQRQEGRVATGRPARGRTWARQQRLVQPRRPASSSPVTKALSGVSSCSPAATYSGPDSGTATVSGTCTDGAGNIGSGSVKIQYDATAPAVEGKAGPGSRRERLVQPRRHGQLPGHRPGLGRSHLHRSRRLRAVRMRRRPRCRANVRTRRRTASQPKAVELSYDATPPLLKRVKAEISRRGIALKWIAVEGRAVVHDRAPTRLEEAEGLDRVHRERRGHSSTADYSRA